MAETPFQDRLPGNHCWGCGPDVETGLRLKSYWSDDETVCTWQPRAEFAAGPRDVLFGGIISAAMDCHSELLCRLARAPTSPLSPLGGNSRLGFCH